MRVVFCFASAFFSLKKADVQDIRKQISAQCITFFLSSVILNDNSKSFRF
ncbi:hypothetical protein AC520_4820 [Enterobacter sp. OLF]|nr:hypothetical protein AC520_4820 [Enterobacter sp. OLF]